MYARAVTLGLPDLLQLLISPGLCALLRATGLQMSSLRMSQFSRKVGPRGTKAGFQQQRSLVLVMPAGQRDCRLPRLRTSAATSEDHYYDRSQQRAQSAAGRSHTATAEGRSRNTGHQLVDYLQGCWDALRHKHMFAVLGVVVAFTISAVFAQPAQAAATSTTLVNYLGDKMLWMLGKISQLGVAAKVLLVLSSTVPFIFLLGNLYSAITHTEKQASYIRMYALLNRLPGAQVLNEKTLPAAVLINAVYFLGLFTFAILLGVVTDEVKQTFKGVREGKYPINQSNHLVVLGWNNQAASLLRQVAVAQRVSHNEVFRRPVAVLADMPKTQLDAEINKKLKGTGLEVLTRSGSPTLAKDLEYVAVQQAASIIILDQGKQAASRDVVAAAVAGVQPMHTAMALASASPACAKQNIVVQAPSEGGTTQDAYHSLARLTSSLSDIQVLRFKDSDFSTRLSTITAVQPGLARVLQQLLGPSTASLYTQACPPELVGKTYQEARRSYTTAVVAGYMRAGRVEMLPRERVLLEAGDKLVLLSDEQGVQPDTSAVDHLKAAANTAAKRMSHVHHYKPTPRHVVVVCLDPSAVPDIVDDLSEFTPKGSSATFLLPGPPPSQPSKKGNCSFKYLTPASPQVSPCSASLLRDASIESATAVMVTGLDQLSAGDADGFVMSTLLQVQDVVLQSGRSDAPHFVAQVRKPSTTSSINTYLSSLSKEAKGPAAARIIKRPDLFVSDDLVTATWAQAASTRDYAALMREVLDADGAELYFRNPQVFNLRIGDLLTFADVAESARLFNETALGYISASGNTVLAPEPTHPLNFQQGDRIIVLAQELDSTKLKRS